MADRTIITPIEKPDRGRYTSYVLTYGHFFLRAGIFVYPATNECTLEKCHIVTKNTVERKGNVVYKFIAPFCRP